MNVHVWASTQDQLVIDTLDLMVPGMFDRDDLEVLRYLTVVYDELGNSVPAPPDVRAHRTNSIMTPIAKTARAVSIGAAIAASDGPIPVMDVVGFGFAFAAGAKAWYDYLS